MPHADELADRLARIERRQFRLSALVALLACGWLTLVAWQFTPRPRVAVREVVVRDGPGPPRAALGLRDDGAPMLRLNDGAGRARFRAVVTPDGLPSLRLTDEAGVHRIVLELDAAARPYVEVLGPDGRPRALVSTDSTGGPWAELRWGGTRRRLAIEPGDTLAPAHPDASPRGSRAGRSGGSW